jgi:ATP-dependent helicase/nuclease subunit B
VTHSGTRHVYVSYGDLLPDHLHDVVSTAKSGNPLERVTVVTPGFHSSFYLRRWMANRGLLNVEFTRIEDLADTLAEPSIRKHGGRSLTRLEGAELVRAAVDKVHGENSYSLNVSQPSFLVAMQRTLRDIEAQQRNGNKISFDKLVEASEITRFVGKTWDEYQQQKVRHNLYGRTQVAQWACEALRGGALNDQRAKMAIGKLVVLLVAEPAAQYLPLWRDICKQPEAVLVIARTGDVASDESLMALFGVDSQKSGVVTGGPALPDAVSAADVRSEVAGLIQRIATDAGNRVPFNRMAVYFGNREYASRVRSALKLAGIPVSGPPPLPLASTRAGRFVFGVLAIAVNEMSRQGVGDWVATCAVKDPATGQAVTGTEWDRLSSAAKVAKGMDSWRSRLGQLAKSKELRAERIQRSGAEDDGDESSVVTAGALRQEAQSVRSLLAFVERLAIDVDARPRDTWQARTNWLKHLISQYLDVPGEESPDESTDRLTVLLDRIGALDTLSASQPDIKQFAAVVERELSETRAGAQKLGQGVFVASIRDAAATQFERVHVLGMVDGLFPAQDSPDPLLPDAVREQLNLTCGINLPRATERRAAHRRQFLAALLSGRQSTLYWPRAGSTGTGEAGPSHWLIEQLRRRPGGALVQGGDLLRNPGNVDGVSVAEYGRGSEFADVHEYDIASVSRHVALQPERTRHFLESDKESGVPAARELERERFGSVLTKWSGNVSTAYKLPAAISGQVLSASRVEAFARCPLKYFFSYVLAVEAPVEEQDTYYLPPDRRGTLVHAVLEEYLKSRISGADAGVKTLDSAMSKIRAEWEAKEPGVKGRVWEIETREIRRLLIRWLTGEAELEQGGWEPEAAEWAFGREDGERALEMKLNDGTVLQFGGVIDRVEKRADGSYYVLDYKTGRPPAAKVLKEDPVNRGKNLQLALYSRAIELLRGNGKPVVAGYWHVLDRKQTITPDVADFDPANAAERLDSVLEVLVESNRSGKFPPNPGIRVQGGFENCRYCDYDLVCPSSVNRGRMFEAHKDDPNLKTYFDLAESRPSKRDEGGN